MPWIRVVGIGIRLRSSRLGDDRGDRVFQSVEVDREQVRLGGTEVVVPEPHRVRVVQDRRDLLVLAEPAQLRLGLERVGARQQVARR